MPGALWLTPTRCGNRRVGALLSGRVKGSRVKAFATRPRQALNMSGDFIDAVIIGFVGAALFLFVDKYERDGSMANLLKLLVLVVGGVAILHKLQPLLGIALF